MDFSVAMCVYGGDNSEWFKASVESVLNQSVKPSEVVLVVDGSVPKSLETVISEYERNCIFNVIRLEKNQGHGNARRVGLKNCKNEFVAIMDADDICVPERFEEQISIFKQNNSVDIVGGDIAEFIDEEANIVAERKVPVEDSAIKSYMKKRCPMNQMTVMFRKSAYERAGGYIDWYQDEDYYLWLRMMESGSVFANTGTVLVHVRVGKDMYKRRGGWKYFKSERRLQRYMLKHRIIGVGTYLSNVIKRFIVQVLLPNNVRGWVFKKFARNNH